MANIQIFQNHEFGPVRTTAHNGEIAFVAKDVAERLGYTWKGITGTMPHIPEEWRGVCSVQTPSGMQEMTVLTEQGLYFFLARSDKPLALPFQKWIAGEVVPSIRKTGSYSAKQALTGNELVAAGYAEAMRIIEKQKKTIVKQQQRIIEDMPKVEFYDLVKYSEVVCHFQGLAYILRNNGIDIGRNRLIEDFRKRGDIKQVEALFTQKALNRGIGQNVQTGNYDRNGVTQLSFRAFLNYKGICEVFDRYHLTRDQREAVMDDMTINDNPRPRLALAE